MLGLGWLFGKPLAPGTPAPPFTLPDQDGRPVSLETFRGRGVALVFYPGDDTPVCRGQLCAFRDAWDLARERGVEVLGINPQGTESHARFRARRSLPFPLLVDRGGRVASLYHAGGRLVRRTVYLVGPDGRIRFARRGTPAPLEVFEATQ
jgi:thioredoxin-dependent peroxiredoxin